MLATSQIDIESLIKTKLPPLPRSVSKISALLQNVNASPRDIADEIGCDPMLAARILRLANSPVYARNRNVTTLSHAVVAVGNKAIYEMVMIGATTDVFGKEIYNSKVGRDNWEHSIAVAIVARELCDLLKMRGTEEAFVCGLLHDIGKILLLRADSKLYTELHESTEINDLPEREKEIFGFDHAQLGAMAAHRWGLPEPLCHMILNHHTPAKAEQALFMTYITNVADGLTDLKTRGLEVADHNGFLRAESLETLRLSFGQLEEVWEKSAPILQEIIKTFA